MVSELPCNETKTGGSAMEALQDHEAQIEAYLGDALGDVDSSLPPTMRNSSMTLLSNETCWRDITSSLRTNMQNAMWSG